MTQRERILAIIVAAAAAIMAIIFGGGMLGRAFSDRQTRLTALLAQVEQKELQVAVGARAANRLAGYEARSLPPEREQARAVYQAWLLDLVQRAELTDVDVKLQSTRSHRNTYDVLTFNVNARGDLIQFTRLLYEFYSANYLHRIGRMNVKPITGGKDLTLALAIEAISLPGSPHAESLPPIDDSRLGGATLVAYEDVIVSRNLFGPPNHAPTLTVGRTHRAVIDRPVSLTIAARDEDDDNLSYSVETDVDGVRVDADSGTVYWTPRSLGDFTLLATATDDGMPRKSVAQEIQVTVVEPPPPPPPTRTKPSIDVAKYTFLTSILEINGVPQIWLINRTTGQRHTLREGEQFEIGPLKGSVEQIGEKQAELTIDGDRYHITVGDPINEGRRID